MGLSNKGAVSDGPRNPELMVFSQRMMVKERERERENEKSKRGRMRVTHCEWKQ